MGSEAVEDIPEIVYYTALGLGLAAHACINLFVSGQPPVVAQQALLALQ